MDLETMVAKSIADGIHACEMFTRFWITGFMILTMPARHYIRKTGRARRQNAQ